MTQSTEVLIKLFKQKSLFIFFGIVILMLLSWLYVFYLSSAMASRTMESNAQDILMPTMEKWNLNVILTTFAMWSVMMSAMMLPSAMPMILVFSTVNRKRHSLGNQFVPTWIFLSGYIIVWVIFSLAITLIQFSLHNFALLSPEMKIINPALSGIILISAGIYQFTRVKEACLKNCQTPLGFMMNYWREGKAGAFVMGLHHGLYCVGCCWVLMILLFILGVMNILWVFLIAIFVFIEKVIQRKYIFSYTAGALLIVWGLGVIVIAHTV